MVELANEENHAEDPIRWSDPTVVQGGKKVRVVLDKIRITDDREPFFKGKGEFRFSAKVWTPDNEGILTEHIFPDHGVFRLSDLPGSNEVTFDAVLFEDWAEGTLAIEVGGVELDTFDPDDRLVPFKRVFTGDPAAWHGHYAPTGEAIDPQDLRGWQIWFRIEAGG